MRLLSQQPLERGFDVDLRRIQHRQPGHGRSTQDQFEAAQIDLKHGITTVRDSYGMLVPLTQVRDRIQRGDAVGARIQAAGNIVDGAVPTPSHSASRRSATSPCSRSR